MDIPGFATGRLPRIIFGRGTIRALATEVAQVGRKLLLVTGARSFIESRFWEPLRNDLRAAGVVWNHETVSGEPSPEIIDQAVSRGRRERYAVVVGLGGGSVLDAAKAIAGLLETSTSVLDHLEGATCQKPYEGPSVPFVAVPTTCGTGSEATRNAVITSRGGTGFKRSFRDERLVAQTAIVDPDLMKSCPPALLAADGMDAFTQLLEAFVSLRSHPFTDALAWSGMVAFHQGFPNVWHHGPQAQTGWEELAYASLLSGICLAQAGLGAVHGLAAGLGSLFDIPHGAACGTLLAVTTEANVRALARHDVPGPAVEKYARVGRLLAGNPQLGDLEAQEALLIALSKWVNRYSLPLLSQFHVSDDTLDEVVQRSRGSSMKTNPVLLSDEELKSILRLRMEPGGSSAAAAPVGSRGH